LREKVENRRFRGEKGKSVLHSKAQKKRGYFFFCSKNSLNKWDRRVCVYVLKARKICCTQRINLALEFVLEFFVLFG